MIRKQLMITEEQNQFIKISSLNFSAFVRNKIQELIDKENLELKK